MDGFDISGVEPSGSATTLTAVCSIAVSAGPDLIDISIYTSKIVDFKEGTGSI
jgi:hypothetical protein